MIPVLRIVGQVLQLPGIDLQIEELGRPLPLHHVLDQLVPLVPDAPLQVPIGEEQGVPDLRRRIPQDGQEALPLHRLRNGRVDQVAEGGIDVQQVAKRVPRLALRNTGAAHNQGHMHAVFVHILLAHQTMSAHRQPVVPREDDDRVLLLPGLPQRGHHLTDLRVRVRDHRVVVRDVPPDLLRGPGPCGQLLVPDPQLPVVEGMLRHEVLRQRNLLRIVHRVISRMRIPRIVWSREGEVYEERPVLLVVTEELDRRPAEQIARVLLLLEVDPLLGIAPGRVERIERHFEMIAHPPEEDPVPRRERPAVGRRAVVPLTRPEGRVAGLLQRLAEHHMRRRNVLP